ncbi:MAG TPA: glutamate-1-semialdehyde 2,1-aminomutase [Chthoniobacterales bacterium]|jgi:glutamate-1-semialdehyde 2,1-aminomutase|nr:glutamate-1-semialdehyde 2,1-aminomutase [Chthoniobacterales bacterium]
MTNSSLFAEAKRYIPGGVNSPVRAFRNVGGEPFFVSRAQGSHIWDVEGREYIDYVGTWGPAILGHAPEVVVEAVRETAKNGLSFGIPNPLEVDMARLICTWVPSVERVRMVNSGTEATMSCIRLARGFTNRKMIVKFEGCYHGHVDSLLVKAGSGALTHGSPDSAGVPPEFAELTITIPFNDPEIVDETFEKYGDHIAAVIVEAVPANAGLFLPKPGYYEKLRGECDRYGALLIFDEVMTGFRVARGGYQAMAGIKPDLTAMGKVIGGGLPIGAFGGRADIMRFLSPEGPVYQAGTLSGNPVAMAAGLSQLRELDRIDGWTRLEELGQQMESGIQEVMRRRGKKYQFNRLGSMFCLFFTEHPVWSYADAAKCDLDAFRRFFHLCLERGVYFAPSQFETGFLCVRHTSADLERTISVIDESLSQ